MDLERPELDRLRAVAEERETSVAALIRLAVLAVTTPIVGSVIKWILQMSPRWQSVSAGGRLDWHHELMLQGVLLDWWWVAWTCLAACFLAGLLLVFRASGYRLMRPARQKQPLAPLPRD